MKKPHTISHPKSSTQKSILSLVFTPSGASFNVLPKTNALLYFSRLEAWGVKTYEAVRWSQKVEQTSGWGVANLFIASQSPDYHTCLTTPRLKSQVGMILFSDPVYSNLSASTMAFWPGALIILCDSLTPGEMHLCVFVWRHERQIKKKKSILFQLYKQQCISDFAN